MTCSAVGCPRKDILARGLCPSHYAKLYRKSQSKAEPIDVDSLLVECWCRDSFVRVPAAEVRACRTRSCKRKECGP